MSYRTLKVLTIVLPTVLIGGFEYVRHLFLSSYIPMETGNFYITVLTFCLSCLFSIWIFRKIRQMNERLIEEQARRAVYEERERLAKELHDGIAQSLFFLNIKLKQGAIEEARKSVQEIDKGVRQAIFNLRALPEGHSFRDRLHKWVGQWSTFNDIEVQQEIDISDQLFTLSQEVQMFGLIQEAFTNIRKHAKADSVIFSLQQSSDQDWQLTICDNGIGLQMGEMEKQHHYGIAMMKERAVLLGASFCLENGEAGGTKLQLVSNRGGKQI